MNPQAVGFNPSSRLLSGLSPKPNVGAYAKGKAMQAASGLEMDREAQNQKMGVQQMQQDSQQRQQQNQTSAQRGANESRERMQGAELDSRRSVFDVGNQFNYATLQRRNQINLQQSVLNGLARSF